MKQRKINFWDVKPYLLCAVILLSIISICVLSINVLHSTSNHMISMTYDIMEEIDQENWEQAQTYIEEFSNAWQKYKKKWAVLLDHKKAMAIDEQTVKIFEHIKTKNKSLAKCELSILLESLNHYPHDELPLPENIL